MTPTVTSSTKATLRCTPSDRPTAPLRTTASTATTSPGTSSARGRDPAHGSPRGRRRRCREVPRSPTAWSTRPRRWASASGRACPVIVGGGVTWFIARCGPAPASGRSACRCPWCHEQLAGHVPDVGRRRGGVCGKNVGTCRPLHVSRHRAFSPRAGFRTAPELRLNPADDRPSIADQAAPPPRPVTLTGRNRRRWR